jgi:hypothetical protein
MLDVRSEEGFRASDYYAYTLQDSYDLPKRHSLLRRPG